MLKTWAITWRMDGEAHTEGYLTEDEARALAADIASDTDPEASAWDMLPPLAARFPVGSRVRNTDGTRGHRHLAGTGRAQERGSGRSRHHLAGRGGGECRLGRRFGPRVVDGRQLRHSRQRLRSGVTRPCGPVLAANKPGARAPARERNLDGRTPGNANPS